MLCGSLLPCDSSIGAFHKFSGLLCLSKTLVSYSPGLNGHVIKLITLQSVPTTEPLHAPDPT